MITLILSLTYSLARCPIAYEWRDVTSYNHYSNYGTAVIAAVARAKEVSYKYNLVGLPCYDHKPTRIGLASGRQTKYEVVSVLDAVALSPLLFLTGTT